MTALKKFPAHGIAILGMNGAGKSTLAHALSKATGFCELDVEDFYFPEQRVSRLHALEHDSLIETPHLGDLPFSEPRSKAEVERMLLESIPQDNGFILAGVTLNFGPALLSRIDLAVELSTPLETRLKRIEDREVRRFGNRVRPGGDMYAQQADFRKMVESRDPDAASRSAAQLSCTVLQMDGTKPVEQNIAILLAHLNDGHPEP